MPRGPLVTMSRTSCPSSVPPPATVTIDCPNATEAQRRRIENAAARRNMLVVPVRAFYTRVPMRNDLECVTGLIGRVTGLLRRVAGLLGWVTGLLGRCVAGLATFLVAANCVATQPPSNSATTLAATTRSATQFDK